MTNTRVSLPLIPALGWPCFLYPRLGGMTSITRLPTGTPARPSFQPGMTPPPSWKLNGIPFGWDDVGQVVLNTLAFRQIEPTYSATTVSPLVSLGPAPLIR